MDQSKENAKDAQSRPWHGEVIVKFRAGHVATYYPKTVASARTMVRYYNKDREALCVRVEGEKL